MKEFQYRIGYFLFVFLVHVLAPFNRKIRLGVVGRYNAVWRFYHFQTPPNKKVYWLHVASSGELEQVLPIMDLLKEQVKEAYLYITFFSPSAEKSFKLESARRSKANIPIPWDYADYSLFDFKWLMKKFLAKLHPLAFIAIHREIWPGVLMACKEKNVPCYLFSAYFPLKTSKTFWKYENWINYFKLVGTVDDESALVLKSVAPKANAQKIGDSRIERVVSRRNFQTSPLPYAAFFHNQKVVVLGSVWPLDFDNLIEAVHLNKDKRFIFVPHEPNQAFTNLMIESLKKEGLKARLWSRWLLEPDTTSQIIFDSVGGLFELYSIAHIAFVGGSFVKRVHNVLEPAAYGLPILTGPLIENSREATELSKLHGLYDCANGKAISRALKELDDTDKYRTTKQNVEKFIQDGLGASKKYVDIILQ